MRPALEHPNVTLLTNARGGARSTPTPAGTAVTEVVVERDGAQETFAADIVVVSCGAANSAKLLLASASDKHPNGLANGSDQVGRNYMFHNSQAVLALSQGGEPDGLPEDARAQRLLLRQRRLRVPARQHPDGRQVLGADVPRREAARDEARARRGRSRAIARHAVDFWLSTEDLPRPDNRVTLDRDGNITLSYTPTNDEPKRAALPPAQVDARRTWACTTTTSSRGTPT